MSFLNIAKRVFGFETGDPDDYDASVEQDPAHPHYRDASVVPLKEQQSHHDSDDDEFLDDGSDQEPGNEDLRFLEIFDGVLAIFNEAQPEFIRNSLDPEAQRRYLYTAMQNSVESYIGSLTKEVRDKALRVDRRERQRLQADLESLREREKQAEQVIAEQQTKQLSAQRQKRALTQRIENNEKRIAALEAEKEQSDLQIRSLMNKLKVAEVKDGDMSANRDELEELRSDVSAKNAENARLNQLLDQQKSEIADLKKTLDDIREQMSGAEMMQMTDEDRQMIMDVQNEMARFEEIKKSKDAKISSQKKRIAELTDEISDKSSQLDSSLARVAALEEQLVALQGMLQDMQSASALEQSLQNRQDMIQDTVVDETVTLPAADKAQEPANDDDNVSAPKRTKAKRKPKVSVIDENLDSVNWLLTVPTDENPAPSVGGSSSDADFGYHPPVKKEIASNDAQLTLF